MVTGKTIFVWLALNGSQLAFGFPVMVSRPSGMGYVYQAGDWIITGRNTATITFGKADAPIDVKGTFVRHTNEHYSNPDQALLIDLGWKKVYGTVDRTKLPKVEIFPQPNTVASASVSIPVIYWSNGYLDGLAIVSCPFWISPKAADAAVDLLSSVRPAWMDDEHGQYFELMYLGRYEGSGLVVSKKNYDRIAADSEPGFSGVEKIDIYKTTRLFLIFDLDGGTRHPISDAELSQMSHAIFYRSVTIDFREPKEKRIAELMRFANFSGNETPLKSPVPYRTAKASPAQSPNLFWRCLNWLAGG